MRFDIWQGDTEPLELQLTGLPDLTGATCTFTMAQVNGSKRVTGPFVVDDPVKRLGHYPFATSDTITPGVYRATVQATLPGGAQETFPAEEPIYVVIKARI